MNKLHFANELSKLPRIQTEQSIYVKKFLENFALSLIVSHRQCWVIQMRSPVQNFQVQTEPLVKGKLPTSSDPARLINVDD